MGPHLPWKKVWKLKIPFEFKLCLWKILRDCLPTKDLLRKFSPSIDTSCGLCQQQRENSDHLLLSCPNTVAGCFVTFIKTPLANIMFQTGFGMLQTNHVTLAS